MVEFIKTYDKYLKSLILVIILAPQSSPFPAGD